MLAVCRPFSSYTYATRCFCITLPMAIALSSIGHRIRQTSSNTSYRTMLSDYVYLALAGSAWYVMVPPTIVPSTVIVTNMLIPTSAVRMDPGGWGCAADLSQRPTRDLGD